MSITLEQRVLSGMRPTGQLHLGHLHGVLKNWVQLQHQYPCFFFVADWHALTTQYEDTAVISASVWDMIVDWLAVGINPGEAVLFIQSRVPEHAELHLLLSMMTPLSWLERVPSYKDQMQKLKEKNIDTYGFLGYPLLQSADILLYKAGFVPVGDDQVAHVELTREVARRFNFLYGREPGFEEKVKEAANKMNKKQVKLYWDLRRQYQEQGDDDALKKARALLEEVQQNLTMGDIDRLYGYLDGEGKIILPEPQPLLTSVAKMPGLDGQKMSKSYNNTISLREPLAGLEKKFKAMPTDPQRIKRTDPGNPEVCPVWQFHVIYSDADTKTWVQEGCGSAAIGCVDCKMRIVEAVQAELRPIQERIEAFQTDQDSVRATVADGCEQAREVARDTLTEVRQAMGLAYR